MKRAADTVGELERNVRTKSDEGDERREAMIAFIKARTNCVSRTFKTRIQFGADSVVVTYLHVTRGDNFVRIIVGVDRDSDASNTISLCEATVEEAVDKLLGIMKAGRCVECGTVGSHDCIAEVLRGVFGMQETDCGICLEKGVCLFSLSCGHRFHKQCGAKLRDHRCPMCRKDIDKTDLRLYEMVDDSSSDEEE